MQAILFFGQEAVSETSQSTLFQQALGLLHQKSGEVLAGGAFALGIVLGVILAFILAKAFCGSGVKTCGCRGGQKKNRPAPARHPAPADGAVELYVGNLSYDLAEEQLLKEFSAFGKVNSARVITNRFNNKSKGFGFVEMPNRPEAEKAIAALNDKELLGRKIRVNEAKNLEKASA